MDRLLAPDGCPWDREQSLESLEPFLLEETYEVLDAMHDPHEHRKELGDLLFQIVFQSALRERESAFDLDDVVAGIRDKLVRRHPHVFAAPGSELTDAANAEDVAANWERIKAEERAQAGEKASVNPLRRLPRGLPALERARAAQNAAADLGFDWPDLEGPMRKVDEEWAELQGAIESGKADEIKEEFGDLLFVLVRLSQKLNIDAEGALRSTNRKFERRFEHVLQRCDESGIDPSAASLEQLDVFWNEAKQRATSRDDG
jgi:tetrapyrrole methylase family protein/MazG family protein/ATP diphosphatase